MSLINFLNAKLKPSVETDAVCEDGYAAANLIADDAEQLQRGFMAFSVTKPPIELIFDFPKAIDLKVIKLWNTNGALRSTAFEIHSKYDGIWERVANVRDINKSADTVTFCYQSDYNSRSEGATAEQQLSSEIVFFFRSAHKMLANTKSLKIVIRATDKCTPVLRKVQIWGLPARSLEKVDRELVRTIWNEITNPTSDVDQRNSSGQRSPTRSIPELNEDSSLKIPEEFLDTITWELMVFPTVLPSGKVVDQSTIDKHSEVEAKWGRLPSDPFTGLEFMPHRKAILNLALKARIEKFLMENAEHFKSVPRSLGSSRVRRSKNRHSSQFASLHCQYSHPPVEGTYSTLTAPKRAYKHAAAASTSTTYSSSSSSTSTENSSSSSAKRAKLADTLNCTALNNYRSATASTTLHSHSSSSNSTTPAASATATSASSASSTAPSSIDAALQQALQKITRFTSVPTATKNASCINCDSTDFAYEIQTCMHLVCRECLVLLSNEQMCRCKTSFRNSDVERYHKL